MSQKQLLLGGFKDSMELGRGGRGETCRKHQGRSLRKLICLKRNLIELQKNKEHPNPGRSSSGADSREDALEY